MADPASHPSSPARPENWRYTIEHEDGRLLRGEVVGRNEAEARLKLRALGGTPLEMVRATPGGGLFSEKRTHLVRSEILDFTRGIAELIDAGIPLRDALASLAQREKRPALRAALVRIEDQVRNGEAFSRALEADSAQFPRLLIALTRAGEASGLLAKNLMELAAQMDDERSLRQDLIGQMIYPMALVVLISLTLVFLSFFVLPQFETIFRDAGVAPPPEPRFVLAVGAFLRAYAVWIPAGMIALAIGARLLTRQFAVGFDRILQAVPRDRRHDPHPRGCPLLPNPRPASLKWSAALACRGRGTQRHRVGQPASALCHCRRCDPRRRKPVGRAEPPAGFTGPGAALHRARRKDRPARRDADPRGATP